MNTKTNIFNETVKLNLKHAPAGTTRMPDDMCKLNDKAARNAKFALNPSKAIIKDNKTGEEIDVNEMFLRKTGRKDYETISVEECIDHSNIFAYSRVENTFVEFVYDLKLGQFAEVEKATSKGTIANQSRYTLIYVN